MHSTECCGNIPTVCLSNDLSSTPVCSVMCVTGAVLFWTLRDRFHIILNDFSGLHAAPFLRAPRVVYPCFRSAPTPHLSREQAANGIVERRNGQRHAPGHPGEPEGSANRPFMNNTRVIQKQARHPSSLFQRSSSFRRTISFSSRPSDRSGCAAMILSASSPAAARSLRSIRCVASA